MSTRDNSFDLIRHFAAFLVLFSHHYALSGLPEPTIPRWDTLGFLAVTIFFSISGYFMPQSFSNSDNFLDFMAKRCRRIFPGLIVCSFIMVYIIGGAFSASSIFDYIFEREQLKTFASYSTMFGNNIPTVFSDFTYKDAINGSLWTLPLEFACYLIIGTLLSFHNSWKTAAILFWFACYVSQFNTHTGADYNFYGITMSYLALFGVAFSLGALLSMTKPSWQKYRLHLAAIALLLLWLMRGKREVQILGTASIAVLTIVIGTYFKDKLINGRFDISYGAYIYAFPIQQIVINRVTEDFWFSMVISAALTVVAGWLSFRYVETPFLKRVKPNKATIEKPSLATGVA